MLMAAELPLPKSVVAHGWFTFGDDKMSKSKGNVLAPADLIATIEELAGCERAIAVDSVRYSLGAFLPYEGDTSFTREGVIARYNSDLANDLGNALNRSVAMAHKFVGGKAPGGGIEPDVADAIIRARDAVAECVESHRLDRALEKGWELVRFLNKYIDTRAPWSLAKSGDAALGPVMRSMLVCLRAVEGVVRPFLPATADAIAKQLGLPPLQSWNEIGSESSLPEGVSLQQPKPIFPRIVSQPSAETMPPQTPEPAPTANGPTESSPPEITIQEFAKVRLRVARVLEAEPIEGSTKLLKLQVLIGDEKRQIIAGIARNYAPIDLIGRQVVVVTNLKPATLMGHQSQGMILAADGPDGGAILLTPESEAPEGAGVH
jgi:methionyl-tRNA synthetase